MIEEVLVGSGNDLAVWHVVGPEALCAKMLLGDVDRFAFREGDGGCAHGCAEFREVYAVASLGHWFASSFQWLG
jgi:hypothetical protein